MCTTLGVSRSGFYKWRTAELSQQAKHKALLMERIRYHFEDSRKRYGSPKITVLLQREGHEISERTVSLYMREMGLRSCVARTYRVQTTDSNHDNPIAENWVNQDFSTSKPNEIWVTDITYIPCREGKLYLASVLDLYTREIVGWRMADRMDTALVLGALDDAYAAKRPTSWLLHHSDRGSQYTSADYRKRLKENRMIASMSRKGNCYDNACIESFHSILKKELIYCNPRFRTKQEAYNAIYQYIEFFYNRKRIHGSIGYLSPVQFAQLFYKKRVS